MPPMSDRSGLKIDGDAIYIYREKGFTFDKDADVERGEGRGAHGPDAGQ